MGKYILLIVAIAVVVIALVVMKSGPIAEEGGMGGEVTGPAPTGNVDDAVAAILLDVSALENAAAETDASLVEENQALTDFGAAFDASQL